MGTNNSQNLQESWHLPPSCLSFAGQTLSYRVLPARLPFLLSSPSRSFSFSSFSHFTHLQPEGLRTEMEFKLKCHSNIRLPDAKTSLFPSGVVPACLPKSICMESTKIEGAPVTEGLSEETNGIGDSRKNDRDRSTFITGNSLRVHSSRVVDSRQNLDAIQSN